MELAIQFDNFLNTYVEGERIQPSVAVVEADEVFASHIKQRIIMSSEDDRYSVVCFIFNDSTSYMMLVDATKKNIASFGADEEFRAIIGVYVLAEQFPFIKAKELTQLVNQKIAAGSAKLAQEVESIKKEMQPAIDSFRRA